MAKCGKNLVMRGQGTKTNRGGEQETKGWKELGAYISLLPEPETGTHMNYVKGSPTTLAGLEVWSNGKLRGLGWGWQDQIRNRH